MAHPIIISCGAAKLCTSEPVQAWQLYTGGYFKQMLNLAIRMSRDVKILSAEYGLLNANDLILPYDVKMTTAIAKRMRASNLVKFSGNSLLGVVYSKAVTGELNPVIPNGTGGMGLRMQYAMNKACELPYILCNLEQLSDGVERYPLFNS